MSFFNFDATLHMPTKSSTDQNIKYCRPSFHCVRKISSDPKITIVVCNCHNGQQWLVTFWNYDATCKLSWTWLANLSKVHASLVPWQLGSSANDLLTELKEILVGNMSNAKPNITRGNRFPQSSRRLEKWNEWIR